MDHNPFASSASDNPFASGEAASAPPPQAAASPFAAAPPPSAHNPYAQQPLQQQQQQAPPPAGGGFFASSSVGGAAPSNSTALVPSQHPSNPYAGAVPSPFGQQPQQQQQPPFGAPPPPASTTYDPFTGAPTTAPLPNHSDGYTQQQRQQAMSDDDFFKIDPPPGSNNNGSKQQHPPQPSSYENRYSGADAPSSSFDQTTVSGSTGTGNYSSPAPRSSFNNNGDSSSHNRANYHNQDNPEESPDRNRYASEIARQAPIGASPLPKAALVRKKGFVLSRISFRTIVMKKWKQTFWVQYGPHTMLWFRSQSDFDDWLNNPYHSQQQRNFLIKLAVNFVHDLYKPNVRGYQVTQCRTKGYGGNKLVRQFKLERWMDYGPTIAAAFGSYDPKEVDGLREALVECMRNTPLNGGIRATGAVRQDTNNNTANNNNNGEGVGGANSFDGGGGGQSGYSASGYSSYGGGGASSSGYGTSGHHRGNLNNDTSHSRRTVDESVAEPEDLLDVDNWDGVPQQSYADPTLNSQHQRGAPAAAPPQQQPAYPPPQPQQYQQQHQQAFPPNANPFAAAAQVGGFPAQPQQQQQPGVINPGAMVPAAANNNPYAYGGVTGGGGVPQQQQPNNNNHNWNAAQQQGYAQQTPF